MSQQVGRLQPGQNTIVGGTDGTIIGNVSDALKATLQFSGNGIPIVEADGVHVDAFGRQRVSLPNTLFNSMQTLGLDDDQWSNETATGGTVTHNANHACGDLAITTSSGSKVYRQTDRSFHYVAGLSKQILMTFVMDSAKTNLRQRVGMFDENNGFYLEQNDTSIRFVKRSKVTGSVVNTVVEKADWNKDKLDGTGQSGVTLDLTKAQILFIDMQWLGVGRVRIGFVIGGLAIICHEFYCANVLSTVYMPTGKLHLRYEIEALGTVASASTLKQICASVIIEGGLRDIFGYERCASTGTTTRSLTNNNSTVVIAIRPEGNELASILPLHYQIMATSANDVYYEIYWNATITGGSWVSASTHCQKNVTATSFSGGICLESGYLRSGQHSAPIPSEFGVDKYLGHHIDGTVDTYAIIAYPITGNGSILGSINYKEIY